MKTILLAAGAAAIALSAGLFSASEASAAPTVAGPKQPIPYAELNAYMKASPKVRARKDWWAGQTASAETGASSNTSATAPSLPADTAGATSSATSATSANPPSASSDTKEAAPQLPSPPPVNAPAPGAVNPPATATPGAPASTTPPK